MYMYVHVGTMQVFNISTMMSNDNSVKYWIQSSGSLCVLFTLSLYRASDRMRKKIKDYAEIFAHIMCKHGLIMRKLHPIISNL